jgi:Spy/CpxP family protein refolding chaperone
MLIAVSLGSLDLSPAQRAAVTKIQTELEARTVDAERALLNALADGIAAGAIDHARVGTAIAQLGSSAGQLRGATVDALNQLHAVLTPPQRVALVDQVQTRWAWAFVQRSNAADERVGMRLARELDLSTGQRLPGGRVRCGLDPSRRP